MVDSSIAFNQSTKAVCLSFSAFSPLHLVIPSCPFASAPILPDKRSAIPVITVMDPVNSTSSNAAVAAASRPSLDSHSKHEQQAPDDDDDDLDPAKFLQSVRELSHQREREDSERFRKLEEEVEKGRQERLARRAGGSSRSFCVFLFHPYPESRRYLGYSVCVD